MVKLIKLRGEYFQLVRSISVDQVKDNMEGLKAWRDRLNCDHVLKHENRYLMVRKVVEAEIE